MKIYEFDEIEVAGGAIVEFVQKHFNGSRIIINSSISEFELYECDVTMKGLPNRLYDLLEQFDNLSGELVVSETTGELWFDFIPDDNFKKFLGRKVLIEPIDDHRLEDFEMGGGSRELFIEDKKQYLADNSPVEGHEDLEAKRRCLGCESVFYIKDYKVVAGPEIDYICCPYYPICDGDILDWVPTKDPVREGDLVYMYKTDRDTYDEVLRVQDEYLDRYYGFREVESYRIRAKEGITIYFAPRNKKLLQLVIVKSSMVRKYGHIIEKRIKEEQKHGFIPEDGFTPAIMFLKSDNMRYLLEEIE